MRLLIILATGLKSTADGRDSVDTSSLLCVHQVEKQIESPAIAASLCKAKKGQETNALAARPGSEPRDTHFDIFGSNKRSVALVCRIGTRVPPR